MTRRAPRLAFAGFTAALLVVHGIVAWCSPLQDDDWRQWTHSARTASDSMWGWLASHFTIADILSYVLAHSTTFHAIVSPLAMLALVIGTFTIAMKRLPRVDHWDDVLGVMLVSALIWIGQPRAGFSLFHRPHVAWHVYGCALAVWTIAPFRCGWRPRGAGVVGLAVLAFLVGGTTRQIATATLVGIVVLVRATPRADRARWMWTVLAAACIGAAIGFIDAPHIEPWKVINRGFEQNLLVLNLPVREGGQVIALVLLLVLARLALDLVWPSQPADLPDPRPTIRWFAFWAGICALTLFGPRASEATALPATLVLVAAAAPWCAWLLSARALRVLLATIAVGLHVILWTAALALFLRLGAEFRERIATLDSAPAGSTAVVRPYSEVLPTWWFYGEDWSATTRQLVAIDMFGLRDVDLAPWFRKLDANPHLAIRLEVTGATDAQVRDASPAIWATDVSNARVQFELFVKLLERSAGTSFEAHLVVDGLPFPERKGRPLYAAWYEHGVVTAPKATRSNPDANDRMSVAIPPAVGVLLPESYLLRDGKAAPLSGSAGAFRLQPMEVGLLAIVSCDPQRCLAIDAFYPKF